MNNFLLSLVLIPVAIAVTLLLYFLTPRFRRRDRPTGSERRRGRTEVGFLLLFAVGLVGGYLAYYGAIGVEALAGVHSAAPSLTAGCVAELALLLYGAPKSRGGARR